MSERNSEQIRYRVTGGVFLTALAIIFLPMLLDGEGMRPVTLDPIERPLPEVAPLKRLSEIAPESDFVDRARTLREAVDEGGFHRNTRTRVGEPVLFVPEDDTSVWAVQVGSFSSPENARAFSDRLRGDGYEAFVSSHKPKPGDDEIINRVAVGPILDSGEAGSLREELAGRYDIEARVMGFGS
ncbi:MAG: SPOR domain-containing protein [Pseudomonadales bacterium]|jgi:DedD protein|nr:SPOR domain-containing protein [Pseudomonadales bacterium]MDP6473142.1 SPOR domain-containing protein [Pseudomonadales bacterium]MDP6826101.1 SPOR domain-containing protein [Pseudomonadales bacterium]MDP6971523.1 SPOR domain-containing protein [Pseudomonadales bacterium]|tara:strand:- start:845 stop:1396 length:552 start_codon:yes stop_codon:yes gene_type:complete